MLVKAKLFSIMDRGIWETNLAKNFFFNVLRVRTVSRLSADTPGTVGDKGASKKPCEGQHGAYSPPGPPGQGPKFLPRSRDPFSYDLKIKGIYSPEATSQGGK